MRRMSSMIQLITDSSADLPKEIVERYNIKVVPLKINIDGDEYLEGVNIQPEEFFEKICPKPMLQFLILWQVRWDTGCS